ncbi:hypothetical protein F7725_007772, partial [Dissostichus mawsoni]
MASIRALLSSSSLRRCMFSRSCRASLNDCKKVSKIPKNSSGCILPSSSPKLCSYLVLGFAQLVLQFRKAEASDGDEVSDHSHKLVPAFPRPALLVEQLLQGRTRQDILAEGQHNLQDLSQPLAPHHLLGCIQDRWRKMDKERSSWRDHRV